MNRVYQAIFTFKKIIGFIFLKQIPRACGLFLFLNSILSQQRTEIAAVGPQITM